MVAKGRPRKFDANEALDKALIVFWQRGFEGTSLSDLTEAMGINRPSLYAAFGDKETLFRRALDRYAEVGPLAVLHTALEQPTTRRVVEHLLRGVAECFTAPGRPAGCLVVQGALSCGETAQAVKQELCCRRAAAEALLRERLERAKAEGDLPPDADTAIMSRYVSVVVKGMSVQAADGASRAELLAVVDMVLNCWPAGRATSESLSNSGEGIGVLSRAE